MKIGLMKADKLRKRAAGFILAGIFLAGLSGCHKKADTNTAFYYWKTTLQLDTVQQSLLKNVAGNRLYLRFFDVVWDEKEKQPMPNAVLNVKGPADHLQICPVVYITNKTMENTSPSGADSLAMKVDKLLKKLAGKNHITYRQVQIDCDWTTTTRAVYFSFLKSFKRYSQLPLEATIRLHQVKYLALTGVPPADKGLLMFYNMGKVSADPDARNSIYNKEDAEKYMTYLQHYPLPLDVALPLFSWSLQIRSGKVVQIYGKIGQRQLGDKSCFEQTKKPGVHRAIKSFYLEGIYIKTDDLFKLEEVNSELLNDAAKQAAEYLPKLEKRNIIYYELSTIASLSLREKDFQKISAHF